MDTLSETWLVSHHLYRNALKHNVQVNVNKFRICFNDSMHFLYVGIYFIFYFVSFIVVLYPAPSV